MNEVNFLPQSYIRKQAKKRRVYRQMILVAVFMVALIGWWVTLQAQTYQLNNQIKLLQGNLDLVKMDPVEKQQLRRQYEELSHQVKVQRELVQSVSFSQIIAVMSRVLPEHVSLRELRIEARRPKPLTLKEWEDQKKKTSSSDPNAKPPDNLIIVELEAIAPDDLIMSRVVKTISEHPLFDEGTVKLRYSRDTEINNIRASIFQVVMEVNLDIDYKPMESREEMVNVR